MVWIIVGLCVLAYIFADAFFEVSAKLSGWWKLRARPAITRAWGAVVGRLPRKRAAPAVAPTIAEDEIPRFRWDGVPLPPLPPMSHSVPEQPIEPAKRRSIGQVATFLWKAKWLILIAVVALWAWGTLGCTLPWAKSRDTLRAELNAANLETKAQRTINARDQELHAIARDLAVIRAQLRSQAQRGRDALQAATPENETPLDPGLVAVWRSNLDGLCVPRADGSRPDSC